MTFCAHLKQHFHFLVCTILQLATDGKTILKIRTEQGDLITDPKHILKETQIFYENLYSSTYAGHEINVTAFIDNTEGLSHLTSDDSDKCEGNITMQECYDSLKYKNYYKTISPLAAMDFRLNFIKLFGMKLGKNSFPL